MIVGNIKRIVRTKVLMILVHTKFIQSAKSANPDMAFSSSPNAVICWLDISFVTRGLCLSVSVSKFFSVLPQESNKKGKTENLIFSF